MEKYLGVKVIQAEKQFKCVKDVDSGGESFNHVIYTDDVSNIEKNSYRILDGYKVVYEDGYTSWSPKDVFEKAYRETGNYSSIILDVNTINGNWNYYDSGDCENRDSCK